MPYNPTTIPCRDAAYNISTKILRVASLALFLLFYTTAVWAQSGVVTGKVIDELNNPLAGVIIREKGTTNGAASNIDGDFALIVSNKKEAIFQIYFSGYKTVEELLGGRDTLLVKLISSAINLEEVVVIGYGTQSREAVTGSVSSVSGNDFNKEINANIAELLQGKIAGLLISNESGSVSGAPSVHLRGISTLGNDQGPFVVIDGIPDGDLATVSPQDIESVSVLKDAAAAAIYGSRSASGVILITTKKGTGAKTSVSYDGSIGVSQISKKPDLLTAGQWREYVSATGQDGSVYDKFGANTDWFNEISRTGVSQNHSVSLSGGNYKSNYRASFSYLDMQGIIKDDALTRYNFRFQYSQRAINDRLQINLTGATMLADVDNPNTTNFMLAYNMLPVYPSKLPDGSWYDGPAGYNLGNPAKNIALNTDHTKNNHFNGNGNLSFTLVQGLDVKTNLYKSRSSEGRSIYQNATTQAGGGDGGHAEKHNSIWDKSLMEWLLEYRNTFSDHQVNAIAGYSWEQNDFSVSQTTNRNFITDMTGADNLQTGQGLGQLDVFSDRNGYKLISFFGRVHYAYQDRYMLTAIVRRDGSSKFGNNHKWGTFPSISAAWNISSESFMKNIAWMDRLKLRTGYGITGNQDGLNPYKTLELYSADGLYYDNGQWLSAYKIYQNANPDLKWEETSMFGVGLDFTLFKGRLSGTIDYYDKHTKDMLYTYKVPSPPFMYDSKMANAGKMTNYGIEALVNVVIIRKKDFSWETSLNLSHNKNEITHLSNEFYTTERVLVGNTWIRGGSNSPTHVVEEGYPVGQFYGWKCLGLDESGKFVFEDKNGNKTSTPTEEDRTYIGSAQPDLNFGWGNNFSYKNWSFSFFFCGTVGNEALNLTRVSYAQSGFLPGYNALNDPLIYNLKQVPEYSSFYIEDASYIRLSNVSLGYTFNTAKIPWLNSAKVSLNAKNLFVITNYSGLDPEVDMKRDNGLAAGIEEHYAYPKARTFSLNLSLVF